MNRRNWDHERRQRPVEEDRATWWHLSNQLRVPGGRPDPDRKFKRGGTEEELAEGRRLLGLADE